MTTKCEIIGKYILPVFRSLVAKELVERYNFTQVEIASKLGTTQAAISQYINSKRALKSVKELEEFLPQIQVAAKKTAMRLAKGDLKPDEVTVDLCEICSACCKK